MVTVHFVHPLTYDCIYFFFFFFNDTATTEIYTLSLHDALPICPAAAAAGTQAGRPRHAEAPACLRWPRASLRPSAAVRTRDRKSTRLNSSHSQISYAVFCLKKKTPADIQT